MADPRKQSIRAANRTTKDLGKLFNKMGNTKHPRGRMLVSYRNATRALREIVQRAEGPQAAAEAQEVLDQLRWTVEDTALDLLSMAEELGAKQALAEVNAWGLDLSQEPLEIQIMLSAWLAGLTQQIDSVLAILFSGGDIALILGDDVRQGILRPGPIIKEGAKWMTTVATMRYIKSVKTPGGWGKQAVPAIDENTTDCCLKVAGQAVPFDKKFKLRGIPRFADEMEWSPFHWYCRTSIVTVPMKLAADDMTNSILSNARAELRQRKKAAQTALELQQRLSKLGTKPDGRRRMDDTKEIKDLRKLFMRKRQRAGVALEGN